MSEQTPKPTASEPTTGNETTGEQTKQTSGAIDDLLNEIDRLGNQLIAAVRTAWNSDQRKQIEDELSKSLTVVASELDKGIRKVAESTQTKNIINKAEEVISSVGEQVRTSKATQDIADGLRKGLQNLNEQVTKFTSDLQKKPETPTDTVQDIPVTKEEK